MPILMKVFLVATDDDGKQVEKGKAYLYPGYKKTKQEGIRGEF